VDPPASVAGVLAGYDHLIAAAQRLQWDEQAIDLTADRARVARLGKQDRALLTELVAGFWVAERAVACELQPFIAAATTGGPAAARVAFAQQARDEARHARFFSRVADEVLALGDDSAVRAAASRPVRALFETELPAAARALAADDARMADAVGLYHLVLEGIVFAVGQQALRELCATDGGLPGIADGIARVQGDERWHIGLGVLHLQRLGSIGNPTLLAARAGRASAAWGPAIATPQRIAHVTTTHARRLRIINAETAAAIESAA
jgi:ribonucleoside-diphosphate reductase beta chain